METHDMQQAEEMRLAVNEEALSSATLETALMNVKAMNHLAKMAKFYANSALVPSNFRGKVEDCFIACEMAARMNVSPMFVMQNLYTVNGRPSWSGQACVALINGCGLFEAGSVEYTTIGERGTNDWGCYVQAIRKKTRKPVAGPVVTVQMAHDEGWATKSGSKWKTMPELMLKYRAAAFFARTECPNILMGFQLADEVRDVHGQASEKIKIDVKEATKE